MSKVYYKDSTVRAWIHDIIRCMNADHWRPDYVVGLTRGGLGTCYYAKSLFRSTNGNS